MITVARKIIEGEADAIEAGYEPMTNPDIQELKDAADKAEKEYNEVAPADRAYDEAEEAVGKLRPQADMLISEIVDELRFNLRKKDPASQRRIIESYGIEIEYNMGEAPADDIPVEIEEA